MHKACSKWEEVPYCFPMSSVKFQGHTGWKFADFDPNLVFPDCNCSLYWPMPMKWCKKLAVAHKRCPVVFQGHLSNFKVIRGKKSPILTQIWYFRTITTARVYQWLWNDDKSLKKVKWGALLFSKVIRHISKSEAAKNADFYPKLTFPDCNLSLNSLMAMKWCKKLEATKNPFDCQGHPSNFSVTQDKKITSFDPNWGFSDCNLSFNSLMALKWCP